MEIRGLEFVTLVFYWLPIQLLSVLLIFCTKRKAARADVRNPTTKGATVAATSGDTQKTGGTTPGRSDTPNNNADADDDDVKFNLNLPPAEDRKDEFDDDEENPLAKITPKQRRQGQAKRGGATGPAGKVAEKANAKNKTREENLERPFLAPNEKQYGVSCYQFEPSNVGASQQAGAPPPPPSAVTPAPPTAPSTTAPTGSAPPPPKKAAMQKSGDGNRTIATRTITTAPTAPPPSTPIPLPAILPNVDNGNTKSTISLTTNKKTKTIDDRHVDIALEKTQKCEGEAAK